MKKVILSILLSVSSLGFSQGIKYTKNDTIRFIVKNEIPRFFAGTFWTGIEFPMKNKNSIYVSGIATYGSNFNSDRQLIGYGGEFQYRSYLGKGELKTNFPFYMAGQLIYRHIDRYLRTTTGYTQDPITFISSPLYSESKDAFNVYYAGILFGCQVFVNQMFTVDLNFGGGLRLTQNSGEKTFTKYKEITNLDYSGVVPKIGVVIGIIQH